MTRARQARDRKFVLAREESLADGLQRMALGQLDLAIELLERQNGDDDERTIHETRKAIKRLRALLRLLRSEIGQPQFKSNNRALREINRRLAGARDAQVMLATLRALLEREEKQFRSRKPVRGLLARLQSAREDTLTQPTITGEGRDAIVGELLAVRALLAEIELQKRGFALLGDDLERIYRKGRRSMRTAKRTDDSEVMHEWRKHVKDLRYAAEMLTRESPGKDKDATRIGRVARQANRLGELLGQEHDLALLGECVEQHADLFVAHKRTRKRLRKLIDSRRRRLRRRALALGERLYRRKPRAFSRAVRKSFDRS
jgi:CHAD domain-containing protein